MAAAASKMVLRQGAQRQRQRLSAPEASSRSRAIVESCLNLVDWKRLKSLHIFLPIQKLNEIDTFPLVDFVRRHHPGIAIYTAIPPVRLEAGSKLQEDARGVPKPVGALPLPAGSRLDVVVVPLLAFDASRHRLGYGQGCYDRFLTQFPATHKIGLCYQLGYVTDGIPAEPHDVPLDVIITESQVYGGAAKLS
ncbi:MAG TPA: 5-formyltetrahydrofolate cyclo-ligase [Candidatus Saccharimonadales bacterium]|nr:5-formyltetrahydrofolate cyclo-ligase [Candidatus Saccharimonadales bacterium]